MGFFFKQRDIDASFSTKGGVDVGFFPKKGDKDAYGSTKTGVANALCKKHEGTALSGYGKNVTELTQIRLAGRLKGNMKFSSRLTSSVRFIGATP